MKLADRPAVPSADQLLPSVELVTFQYDADGAARRDTVSGRERVARWLGDMADRTGGDPVPFMLQTSDIRVCDGAAVERGLYPASAGTTERPGATERYLALWRQRDDDWGLERLWLSPPPSMDGDDLATDCLARPWGVAVGVTAGLGSSGNLSRMVSALPDRYDEVTASEGLGSPEVELWVSVPVSGWLRAQLHYGNRRGVEFHAQNFSSVTAELIEELFFDARIRYLSVLAEARLGPAGVAVGPLLVENVLSGTYDGVYGAGEDSGLYTKLGGEARIFGGLPFSPRLQALFSAGYRHVPALNVSEFLNNLRDAALNLRDAAPLYPGGLDFTIGMEFAF